MYNQNSINASSSSTISVESIESSVTKLDQTFNRRRRWKLFFNPRARKVAINTSPWRNNLAKFLDSNPTHIVSIVLLVSDIALTVLDLSSTFQSCPRTAGSKEEWSHWVGIAILGLLLVKTLGLLVGQGWSFFTRPGYIVDGLVLIGAVFMEVFMAGKGGGLLVVVSLWRVIRVVESAFELSDDAIESQIEAIKNELDQLKLKEENSGQCKVNS